LTAADDWIAQNPGLVLLLKAIDQADTYILRHALEAESIIGKRINLNNASVAEYWSAHNFSLSLDQSLILAMEDETRWMIANNLTKEFAVPDFLDYIYRDALVNKFRLC
jgi:hypothetical protein